MKKVAQIQAPAKAILCGEHAVVYGQDAIAFGVQLKCKAEIYKSYQQKIQGIRGIVVHKQLNNEKKTIYITQQILALFKTLIKISNIFKIENFTLNEFEMHYEQFCTILIKQNSLNNYQDPLILSTMYKIVLFFNIFHNECNLTNILHQKNYLIKTSSQIPIGKGLGSSASFNTILACSLAIIFGLIDRKNIEQNNQNYKQVINHISKKFEQVQHGNPSGIDNFVSVYGGLVLFNKKKNPSFKQIDNPLLTKRLNQLICFGFVDSHIEKNTKLAVSNVLLKYNEYLQGQFKYKNMIESIGQFATKIIDILSAQNLNDQEVKQQLFLIISLNHSYLRELGLSNQKLEEIVNCYTKKDKSTAKITGAGMGGVVLVVGDKNYMRNNKSESAQQKSNIVICDINTKGLEIKFQ